MTEITPTEAPAAQVTRAFFRADYRRFAYDLRKARTGRDGQLKPAEQQELVDQAAAALAMVFAADSSSVGDLPYPFDMQKFVEGTHVLVPATIADLDEDLANEDEDEDEDVED